MMTYADNGELMYNELVARFSTWRGMFSLTR
jgi:hypothetical protein